MNLFYIVIGGFIVIVVLVFGALASAGDITHSAQNPGYGGPSREPRKNE